MTGIELFKKSSTTAGEIADIVSQPCLPETPPECETISCRECWRAWLVTGNTAREKESSNEQTAPSREQPLQGICMKIEEAAVMIYSMSRTSNKTV